MNISKNNSKSKWTTSGLIRLLKNPIYMGYIWWGYRADVKSVTDGKIITTRPINKNYEMHKGIHEAIIDEKLWKDTQYALNNNKVVRVPKPFLNMRNPLAGVVRCKLCGRSMERRVKYSSENAGLMCPTLGCNNISSKLADVEYELLEELKAWLSNYKFEFDNIENKGIDIESQIKVKSDFILNIKDEQIKINKQIDNLHNLLEQGVYDIETFKLRKQILNDKVIELQQSFLKTEKEIKALNNKKKYVVNYIPMLENVIDAYYNTDSIEVKNELLKSVLEKVEYLKTEKGTRKTKTPFSLTISPKLPNE